ncbi:MAG: type II toxin-antitoxin system HicB family antitoxin [Candidatus Omnitrophota bacterium]|jgi:predicted RNase H-like HicB family nuclease|nr:MAG: type II toxin-antitoxin system HicB family antitoxin [Candidatus Omnitrophota bacterium]
METKTYQFTVEFEQDEDGVYIADVPALQGCHSFGATLEEAERNILEAITGYLEMLQKHGKPIPFEKPTAFILKKPAKITIPA